MLEGECLRRSVINELEWKTPLHALFIGVGVSHDVVTLTGRVHNSFEKEMAEVAAIRAGASGVVNDLRVYPAFGEPDARGQRPSSNVCTPRS
jgi:osmotically-inducible protein OsmY